MEVESEVKELKEEFRQMKKIVRKNFLLQWVLSHELGVACNDSLNEIQGSYKFYGGTLPTVIVRRGSISEISIFYHPFQFIITPPI